MQRPSSAMVITLILITVMGSPFYIPRVLADVLPGYDLFETVASQTSFTFEDPCTTIPARFFDPGSLPFGGAAPGKTVPFQGVPLASFMGFPTGTTDTIVQRLGTASLPPPFPATATPIPIELVALSLVSTSPITISFTSGASQLWNVRAAVSTATPSTGTITITQTDLSGGTFTSTLSVFPLFTFTRVSDGAVRTLDAGVLAGTPCVAQITLTPIMPVPWVYVCPPPVLVVPPLNGGFCASSTSTGKTLTTEQSMLAMHGIKPAQPPSISVSKFYTDGSMNALPKDSHGNPSVNVTLARSIVRSTNPGQILAWVDVTNTGELALQSLILNEALPVDWTVDPSFIPAVGAIHVFFGNVTSLATNLDITQPSTITVSPGNPEIVNLAISNFTATTVGHLLMPGQSVLLSVKLTYGLISTTQSIQSYPRNYTDTASATVWQPPGPQRGTQAFGTGSAFFIAYAKVVSSGGGGASKGSGAL